MPEDEKICGDKADGFRLRCSLPAGHVKTLDDWHESTADHESRMNTNTTEQIIKTTETVRWLPNVFEIDDAEERGKEFGSRYKSHP